MRIKDYFDKIVKMFDGNIGMMAEISSKLDEMKAAASMNGDSAASAKMQQKNASLAQQLEQERQNAEHLRRKLQQLQQLWDEEAAAFKNKLANLQADAQAQLQAASEKAKHTALAELRQWTDFQAALLQDTELAALLLNRHVDEGALPQLMRLMAVAAQWEMVEAVWDELKKRCDRHQRPATAGELALLAHCLAAHNLAWHDRQAKTCDIEAGTAYDYKKHTRATPRGETIVAQWLPELDNAGGVRVRQALVATQ